MNVKRLTFKQNKIEVVLTAWHTCRACGGSGYQGEEVCSVCNGSGEVY